MAVTNFTPLLGLALPTTGDLSGTWGTTVNDAITDLLDDAVAGTVTLATDANVTLSTTNGANNQARNAIILCTGARTAIRTITAPAQSKLYVIINATTGGFGVKIVGAGPTTGITILAGTQVMVAWNGSDFVVTASGDLVGPASSTDNAITRFDSTTGKLVQNSVVTVADDGAIVAPQAGSTIPFYFANQAAFPTAANYHGALAHSHADGAMFFAHAGSWVRMLDADTDVTVAQGGTGLSTLTANNVILGNGTSTPLFVAPSSSGNVLTSNGTTWSSSAPAAGGITYTAVKVANYTAVNNDGVLTNTTGGAFTVTLPTSPSVGNIVIVVDSFSQWGTYNLTVDPTASIKIAGNTAGDTLVCDITGATVTLVYTGASYGWNVSAQVGGNGGTAVTLTGVQTLTNKTIAFGSNTLSDVASLSTAQTFTSTKTFSGTSSAQAIVLNDAAEIATVSATAATGTINYDITTQSVLYYTSNASANWTVNFRGSSGTSLNTLMTTGQSMTVAFLVTQGATAYYNSAVTVDSVSVTPKYQGGTAYAAGNASSIDVYMYTIIKTGNAAFTVFTSQTKFA